MDADGQAACGETSVGQRTTERLRQAVRASPRIVSCTRSTSSHLLLPRRPHLGEVSMASSMSDIAMHVTVGWKSTAEGGLAPRWVVVSQSGTGRSDIVCV